VFFQETKTDAKGIKQIAVKEAANVKFLSIDYTILFPNCT